MTSNRYTLVTTWKSSCPASRRFNEARIPFSTLKELRKEFIDDPAIAIEEGTDFYSCRGFLFWGCDIVPGFNIDCGEYYVKVEENR